jgi:hypothetical protein
MELPYNPLDRVELGKSVERALLARPLVELRTFLARKPEKFPGAGVYALYYVGSLPYYAPIAPPAQAPGETPVYVGRARPKGARQGSLGLQSTTTDPQLYDRLHEHGLSIATVEKYGGKAREPTLAVADFLCRYLVADEIWVPMGEALLIGHYRPVWNVVVDGFGNHGPGGGRKLQARSSWDTLHTGRKWALRLPAGTGDSSKIRALIAGHFEVTARPDLAVPPVLDEAVMRALAEEDERSLASTSSVSPKFCRMSAVRFSDDQQHEGA